MTVLLLLLLLALLRGGRRRREAEEEECRPVGRRWVVSGRAGSSLLPLLLLASTAPSSSKGKTLSMPVRVVCGVCGEHVFQSHFERKRATA